MTEEKAIELQKEQVPVAEGTEPTRECQCFVPRADIYETPDSIVVVTDMPGVTAESLDVTLEKNILTINGYVSRMEMPGYGLTWAEYEVGDYQRRFTLSDEVDRDGIEAVMKDGVLRLYLPKAKAAQTRKIDVKVG